MFVDCAIPFFLIKKHAGAFEDVVLVMSQHASLVIFFVLGEFLFGLFVSQVESFGQPLDVAFIDPDPVVRTTVTGTFGAVVPQARLFRFVDPIRLKNRQFFFRHKI